MSESDHRLYEGLKYGTELFKYHAEQRLRCIRYYIVIFLASVAGIVGLERILCDRKFSAVISILIILFTICVGAGITLFFWLLDIRNRVLTEYAEKGLKNVEHFLFGRSGILTDLKIVNNCEDKIQAWHYGIIVPFFFFLIISTSILIALTIAIYNYCYSSLTLSCFLLLLLFVLILCSLLWVGVYSEGKFLKAKPSEHEKSKESIANRLRQFLFTSSWGRVIRTLLIVLGVCAILIILAFLILWNCPP